MRHSRRIMESGSGEIGDRSSLPSGCDQSKVLPLSSERGIGIGAGGWTSFNVVLPARVPSDQSLRTHPLGGLDLFIMGCPIPG